ncbi:MAG: cobalamin biosynthesis protein [Polyangiales bacterium]
MREALVIGVGCTRGTPSAALGAAIDAVLAQHGLDRDAVRALASLDSKHDEGGLVALAHARGWTLALYSAAALAGVAIAQPSAAVHARVGTPGVAEPAALLHAKHGPLRVAKTVHRVEGHAITIAVAAMHGEARDD